MDEKELKIEYLLSVGHDLTEIDLEVAEKKPQIYVAELAKQKYFMLLIGLNCTKRFKIFIKIEISNFFLENLK